MGKILVRALQWWAESTPPGWDRVKVFENLGATAVASVAPADTSLDLKRVLSNLEGEVQGCGIIMGVTRLLLLGPFFYIALYWGV